MGYVAIKIKYLEDSDFLASVVRRNDALSEVRPEGYNLCAIDEQASTANKDGTRTVHLVATFEKQ